MNSVFDSDSVKSSIDQLGYESKERVKGMENPIIWRVAEGEQEIGKKSLCNVVIEWMDSNPRLNIY